MGCPTGKCAVNAAPELEPGLDDARLISELVQESASIDHGECCAHCSGVTLDPLRPPVTPAKLLKDGSGCPMSVVAYRARKERDKGHKVQVVGRAGKVPVLLIDGAQIDAMSEYKTGECGC